MHLYACYFTAVLPQRKENSKNRGITSWDKHKVKVKTVKKAGFAMRKLLTAFIIILVLHTTYYDLTTGTLATYNPPAVQVVSESNEQGEKPYVLYKVTAGDTVLSIVEKTNGSIPVSIDTVVDDFKQLNGIPPTHIQIGEQYKVPSYMDVETQ
ncbi:LysM peptidoglycan-binding domain-containing protein [Alkalihalobacillus sp. CinArs1]|uniref:LysM peptidoglycan-binding domain-containing protein n=1 Tax=Alkalihalobacillus sp. CinArs1 TaxID=2995314 RepID=UPI0022DDCCD3|nr:LysM domain-containing protein [Alkalihalobacillus sp. CinArs1]